MTQVITINPDLKLIGETAIAEKVEEQFLFRLRDMVRAMEEGNYSAAYGKDGHELMLKTKALYDFIGTVVWKGHTTIRDGILTEAALDLAFDYLNSKGIGFGASSGP
jgi:hypothetical protein